VTIDEGQALHAGTVNLVARVVMQVDSTGSDTRVGRLMAMVEQLARDRPPIVRLADRVAHWFVIVVLSLAAATSALWLWLEPARAVENTIALLIVTCPCALGLATPLALVAAIGRAAKRGILIKGGEALETLAGSGSALLDKTGTLTRGTMELLSWNGADSLKPRVLAIESQVVHPVARAFCQAFAESAGEVPAARVTRRHGSGVAGECEGSSILIGSVSFVRARVEGWPEWVAEAVEACVGRALTPVVVAIDGQPSGVAGFGDPALDDAAGSIDALRRLGWEVRVLSGDHPAVVDAVAGQVGLDRQAAEGEASPERKVQVVQELIGDGATVAMVGDGVNDAAALSAASVGIAVHGGAEASLAAADVFLRRPGLAPVVELFRGARRAVGVIRRNIVVSLLYNLIMASLAVGGWINPLIAAVLMPIISLTVVALSYRSRTFGA